MLSSTRYGNIVNVVYVRNCLLLVLNNFYCHLLLGHVIFIICRPQISDSDSMRICVKHSIGHSLTVCNLWLCSDLDLYETQFTK